jgi:hypothetical protein
VDSLRERGRRGTEGDVVTLRGDAGTQEFTDAMAILDRSGLAYAIRDHPRKIAGDHLLVLTWGPETLTGFSHRQLVDFLWAHGAQFEDS